MEPPIDDDLIWQLVVTCLERSAPDRAEFLAELRATRPHVAAEVARLLVEQDAMGLFLSNLVLDDTLSAGPGSLPEGTVVDKYRVQRHLASGGMGDVYLANRVEEWTAHLKAGFRKIEV